MGGLNHEGVAFSLTREERDLILKEAETLDEDLAKRLRFGIHEGKRLRISMALDVFDLLLDMLAVKAEHAQPRSIRRQFERLYDRLVILYNDAVGGESQPPDKLPSGLPPEVRAEMQRLLDSGQYKTLDEVNRELQKISEAHNARPRDEFGGLSPKEMSDLLYSPFGVPESGLQLNPNLPLADVQHVEILANARVLLQELEEAKETKATAKLGNLNRKFVARMLDRMQWPKDFIEELWRFNKVVNEEDVFPLHTLRIVLEMAGLIRKYAGAFRVTKKGRALCKEEAAGELFALLFLTYFRDFNLSYLDRLPEHPMVQGGMAYSLYRIARDAGSWQTPEQLAGKVLLPLVADEVDQDDHLNFPAMIVETRMLRPLGRFGLVESRHRESVSVFFRDMTQAKKTSLFDRFLRFTVGR